MGIKKNRNGFTIVEVVIVMAIIAILTATAVPIFRNIVTNKNETQMNLTAATINNAIIEVMVREHGQPIIDLNDTNSTYYQEIINKIDIEAGETINFKTYDSGTKSDLPDLSSYNAEPNVWVVYIPEDRADNTYDFNEDIVIFTPAYKTVKMYVNGNEA